MVCLVFIGFLYPPRAWKAFLRPFSSLQDFPDGSRSLRFIEVEGLKVWFVPTNGVHTKGFLEGFLEGSLTISAS